MCIVIGDSIGDGIAQAAYHQCVDNAHKGWTSTLWDKTYPQPINDGLVVISLGTNDGQFSQTEKHLLSIRSRITSKQVIWILPHNTNPQSGLPVATVQGYVRDIAAKYGDRIIVPKHHADRLHPTATEYRRIAKEILSGPID